MIKQWMISLRMGTNSSNNKRRSRESIAATIRSCTSDYDNDDMNNDSKQSLFVGCTCTCFRSNKTKKAKCTHSKNKNNDQDGDVTTKIAMTTCTDGTMTASFSDDYDYWVNIFSESVTWGDDNNLGNYGNPHAWMDGIYVESMYSSIK